MPGDVRINIGRIQRSKAEQKKTKNREIFVEMRDLLMSIQKMRTSRPERALFSVIIKKFIYNVTSVRDEYFLSDICEPIHDLFLEFRLALGHYDHENWKKLQVSLEDVVEMSEDICGQFEAFMDGENGGYVGTEFPKPRKLRSMRELRESVREGEDVFVLHRAAAEVKPVRMYSKSVSTPDFPVEVALDEETTQTITKILIDCSNNNNSSNNNNITTSSSSSSSNSSSMASTPKAPSLYTKEVSTLKTASKGLEDSLLVAAMGELMAPPPPPNSNHGRISYISNNNNNNNNNNYNNGQRLRSATGLKGPMIVDDEGDILPPMYARRNEQPLPQPKSAAASIYESSGGRIIVDNVDKRITTVEMYLEATCLPKFLEDEDEEDGFIKAYRESALAGKNGSNRSVIKDTTNNKGYQESGWIQRY